MTVKSSSALAVLSDTARKEEGLQHTPVSASGHQYHMVELRCFTSLLAYCPWQPHACSDAFHACLFFYVENEKRCTQQVAQWQFLLLPTLYHKPLEAQQAAPEYHIALANIIKLHNTRVQQQTSSNADSACSSLASSAVTCG